MKNYPLVSIVIPVYNGSKYMKEAIDSALTQTYKNFEVIVVNDGSNDGGKTEKIAKSYGKKIRYFKKPNGGVASALNLAIRKMKGEWFTWLSHDDVYFPSKLSDQLAFADFHSSARFIFSKDVSIDEKGKLQKDKIWDWKPTAEPQIRQLLKGARISGCTTLIHKSCFEKVGLFNEISRTTQDFELWLLMSIHYKFFRCRKLVLKRRTHPMMDTIRVSDLHKREEAETITRVVKQLDIRDIYPDLLSNNHKNKDFASCYSNLGDILYQKYRLVKLAREQYVKSRNLWPSLFNTVNIKLALGNNIYHAPYRLRNFGNDIIWKTRIFYKTLAQKF